MRNLSKILGIALIVLTFTGCTVDNTETQVQVPQEKKEFTSNIVSNFAFSCFSVIDSEEFKAEINNETDLPYTYVNFDKFFNNPEIIELWKQGKLEEICFSGNSRISFLFCGVGEEGNEFGEAVLGIYTSDDELVTDKGKGLCSDVSTCSMKGFLDGDLIYSCGRGDGPWSEGKTYILNIDTGQSKLIRDCYYGPEEINCEIDMLGFY